MIHFEIIFVYGARRDQNLFSTYGYPVCVVVSAVFSSSNFNGRVKAKPSLKGVRGCEGFVCCPSLSCQVVHFAETPVIELLQPQISSLYT